MQQPVDGGGANIGFSSCSGVDAFLMDCVGKSNQSEAAYYPDAPRYFPQSIANVTTPKHGLKDWENARFSTIFDNSGGVTNFTATLESRPADGLLAGNASNSWGTSFVCYAMEPWVLYGRDDRDCSAVYDCNHADVVSVVGVTTGQPLSAASSLSSPTASNTGSVPKNSHLGLSGNAIVGLAVGVAALVIILTVTAILLVRRKWSRSRKKSTIASKNGTQELDSRQIHEAGGRERPYEAIGDHVHVVELDAKPARRQRQI
ncbi:hypothetical protein F5Y18DRAFT_426104 [Xylariaceae sp. FL1019]|nr:hypothetical protein F5Y18DRAFT_426104 [Xylariaceae sp. FL1019]